MSNKVIRKLFAKLFTSKDPVFIIPFGGYANENMIHAQARVLEDEGINESDNDNIIKNLYNSYKRFESDEIAGAKVIVKIGAQEHTLISDDEGYIYLNEKLPNNIFENTKWIPITYQLVENDKVTFEVEDKILKPLQNTSYGVISDLDDTVIHTGVSSILKWRLIINSVFKQSSKRLPLKGAQEFYKQLYLGKDGKDENPFFYLSNSPWNIYNYLHRFLSKYNFPKGTILLRDMGYKNKKPASFLEGNKFIKIKHILETYPNLNFILIGDAADIDSEIYIEIARQFKTQVLSIYIRTVSSKRKMRKVQRIIEATTDVEVVLIENTNKAMIHAKENGYIS